jgi:type I restriction enzyme M protein
MAQIEDIGYDANGRLTLSEEEAHQPPDVTASIAEFARQLNW